LLSDIRLPDLILSGSVGIFLIDATTVPASVPLLYGANSLAFGRLWFLCSEAALPQYAAALHLEQAVSEMDTVHCQIFRELLATLYSALRIRIRVRLQDFLTSSSLSGIFFTDSSPIPDAGLETTF
jgi:hypothetical protein